MEHNYDRQRAAGFTCRVKKHPTEESARRVLWAIKLNGRLRGGHDVRYCRLCEAWHIVRVTS